MTDARQAGILSKRRRFAARQSDSMDLRPPVTAAASLLLVLAFSFVVTAGVAALGDGRDAVLLFACAAAAAFLGVGFGSWRAPSGKAPPSARANCRCSRPERRCFSWSSRPLPFALGSSKMSFAAAIFEATSGLMTNGASALASPDTTGTGLLFLASASAIPRRRAFSSP